MPWLCYVFGAFKAIGERCRRGNPPIAECDVDATPLLSPDHAIVLLDEQSDLVIQDRRKRNLESLSRKTYVPKQLKRLIPEYIGIMRDQKRTSKFLQELNLDSSALAKDLSEAVTTQQQLARLVKSLDTMRYLQSNTSEREADDDDDEIVFDSFLRLNDDNGNRDDNGAAGDDEFNDDNAALPAVITAQPRTLADRPQPAC